MRQQQTTELGFAPPAQISCEQAIQGQAFDARSFHAAAPVVFPHLLLEGQKITASPCNDVFGTHLEESRFESDYQFWLDFIRFGLKNDLVSTDAVSIFLDAPV